MKEKRENYVKPLSYVIETEQSLMDTVSISIGGSEHKPGPCTVRRYEDYEEEEEDDWN